jgi:TonB family protein
MLLFKAALSADQTLVRNRFYLVGAIVWSVVVPILTMQQATSQGNLLPAVVISPTYTINIPELVVTPNSTNANGDWGSTCNIILTIYLTGVAIFLLKMVGSYIRVIYIIATAKNLAIDSYQIKVTRAAISPFAFFGWIVFPEKLIEHRDLTKMLIHERVHSRHWHSLDMLLGEIFTVFQWFNPASWMLKRLIVENHEYTADRAVVDLGIDTYEYQASLVNATVGREVVPVNHFSLILIKKRITMMNKKSSSAWLKVKSLLVPVAFIGVLMLSSFTVVQSPQSKKEQTPKPQSSVKKTIKEENPVYNEVEVMPTFKHNGRIGSEAMMEFLVKNISYPKEAQDKNIQGTVYVSFIVEKDGSISNAKVIRGVHKLLDKEALRVVNLMPKWIPGKQNGKTARVAFTMPVKFALK